MKCICIAYRWQTLSMTVSMACAAVVGVIMARAAVVSSQMPVVHGLRLTQYLSLVEMCLQMNFANFGTQGSD